MKNSKEIGKKIKSIFKKKLNHYTQEKNQQNLSSATFEYIDIFELKKRLRKILPYAKFEANRLLSSRVFVPSSQPDRQAYKAKSS